MKKSNKILLIIFILILVLWFGSNLGLYLYTKYFLIGEERLELINRVPEIIQIDYNDIDGQKIYFGDMEFKLPIKDHKTIKATQIIKIDRENIKECSLTFLIFISYENKRKSFIISNSVLDTNYLDRRIGLSNATLLNYSIWNIIENIDLYKKLVLKSMVLLNKFTPENYHTYIVNSQSYKGFLRSFQLSSNSSSFIANVKDSSYSLDLIYQDVEFSDDMNNIISSIKPIEDSQNVIEILSSNYKKGVSIFEKQLALISLISIEGPTIDNLSELKKLLIQKGARTENIEDIQEQIEILKNNANKISN